VPTRTHHARPLRPAVLLAALIALLCHPAALRAEIQVASSFQDPVFSNWINDSINRVYWVGQVRIERFACSLGSQRVPSPVGYYDYPNYIIIGCAASVDDARAQILAKIGTHLRSVAGPNRNAGYAVQFSTLVILQNGEPVSFYGRAKRTSLAALQNTPDDGPGGDCSDASRPQAGDPIAIGSGQSLQVDADYRSPLSHGLSFQRFYNSADSTEGDLGVGWQHTFMRRIVVFSSNGAPAQADVVRASGRLVHFEAAGGTWTPDATEHSSRQQLPDWDDDRQQTSEQDSRRARTERLGVGVRDQGRLRRGQ